METVIRAAVLKARGDNYIIQQVDDSGEMVCEMLRAAGYDVVDFKTLPDSEAALTSQIRFWGDRADIDVILTIGGVGLADTERMPEATLAVSGRIVPGIAEYLRHKASQLNVSAVFNRGVAVTYKNTLIVNLHGGSRGAKESLTALMPVLRQAIELMNQAAQ